MERRCLPQVLLEGAARAAAGRRAVATEGRQAILRGLDNACRCVQARRDCGDGSPARPPAGALPRVAGAAARPSGLRVAAVATPEAPAAAEFQQEYRLPSNTYVKVRQGPGRVGAPLPGGWQRAAALPRLDDGFWRRWRCRRCACHRQPLAAQHNCPAREPPGLSRRPAALGTVHPAAGRCPVSLGRRAADHSVHRPARAHPAALGRGGRARLQGRVEAARGRGAAGRHPDVQAPRAADALCAGERERHAGAAGGALAGCARSACLAWPECARQPPRQAARGTPSLLAWHACHLAMRLLPGSTAPGQLAL